MKIIQKLKSHRGETMIEMLVSMMILTLVICLLVTMIATSYQFNRQARELDKDYRDELSAAENFNPEAVTHGGTITLKLNDGSLSQSITVDIYSSTDSELKSYKLP